MEYFNWLGFTTNKEIENNVKDLNLLELKMKRSFSSSNIDKEKIKRDVSVSLENHKELKKSMSLSNVHYLEENETIKSFEINNNENMDVEKKNNEEVQNLIKEENLNNSDIWIDKNSSSPDSYDDKRLDEMKNEIISEVTESVSASYEYKIRQIKDKVKFEMKLFDKILESLKTINKDYYYYKGMTFGMTLGFGVGYYFFKK